MNGVDHPYGFGGKEEQEELGLDWHDFHARNYDAALGRWMNMDPMAEDYFSLSPYNYVANSPLSLVDPTGMWIETVNKDGSITYTAEDGDSAWSLFQQFGEQIGISAEQADEIIQGIFGENRTEGGEEFSNINPEDAFTVYNEQEADTDNSGNTNNTDNKSNDNNSETSQLTAREKLEKQVNAMSPAQRAAYKACCYAQAVYYANQADLAASNPEIAERNQMIDVMSYAYSNSYPADQAVGPSRSARGNGKTRTTIKPRVKSTVKVSGKTLNVQTGPRGGKYYINKNGNKTYLNRDGTKRN